MEREALHSAAVNFSLDLHPSATGDVMAGVRDQLNASLLRPSVYLDGVLVSYISPRILSSQARIHPYFPYFHVDVSAECILFKPAVGQILDGKVHMVSHDFIGLLILGLFNVSIGRQQIRADLNYDIAGDCWKSQKHAEHCIARDTILRFRVEKIDDESEFFTLAGSLLAAATGDIAYLSQQSKKKSKKRRRSEAVATDAAPSEAAAAAAQAAAPTATTEAAQPAARAHAMPNGDSAKALKKAGKKQRKAAQQEIVDTAAQEQGTDAAATADRDDKLADGKRAAGDKADTLSPNKKKRRKHHSTPPQAPGSAVNSSQQMDNAQSHVNQAERAAANGDAQASRAAAKGSAPQAVLLESPAGAQTAKQKPHKKKRREIDKAASAVTPATSSGHAQAQTAVTANAAANGGTKKKKRKKHKEGEEPMQ